MLMCAVVRTCAVACVVVRVRFRVCVWLCMCLQVCVCICVCVRPCAARRAVVSLRATRPCDDAVTIRIDSQLRACATICMVM